MRLLPAFLISALLLAAEPRSLFNGRNLSGWVHEGPRATFGASAGELSTSGAGNEPNWLHTETEFEDFRLTFEYRLAQWAEAAVILRAPRAGRPMQSGLAIYLAHDFHEDHTAYVTGAVAGIVPPAKRLPTSYGAWHAVSIDLQDGRLKVEIDGAVVQDLDIEKHPELRHRLKRGFIGFPDLGHKYSLRNIKVEDRGFKTNYVALLSAGTLADWSVRGDSGHWSLHNGVVTGENGHSILYAAPVFRNFELTALVRSRNRVNGGIFLRGSPHPKEHRGFEIQVYSPLDSVYPTGSIYGKQRSDISAEYEERWFLIQIRVEGASCKVRLDGRTVAEFDKLSDRDLRPGRIGLQIHANDASIEFRDLKVRSL